MLQRLEFATETILTEIVRPFHLAPTRRQDILGPMTWLCGDDFGSSMRLRIRAVEFPPL
jgi:hypothetical protein